MPRLLHPLLVLIARASDTLLAPYVEFLLAEQRMLRSRLPKKIEVAPEERARLGGLLKHYERRAA